MFRHGRRLALLLPLLATGCITSSLFHSEPIKKTHTPVPVTEHKVNRSKAAQAITEIRYAEFQEKESQSPKLNPLEREAMLERARKAYRRALELDPSNVTAAVGLARVYGWLGDHKRATETFEEAKKRHPQDALLWFELGMYHARRKQFDPAIDCLSRAVELEPDNKVDSKRRLYEKTLGFCLARAGRVDESVGVLSAVYGKGKALLMVARMLNHLKRSDEARTYFQLALREEPTLVDSPQAQQLRHVLGEGVRQAEHRQAANPGPDIDIVNPTLHRPPGGTSKQE